MVRGRYREIAYPARGVDRFELALGTTGDPLKVANNLIFEQRRRPLVAKGSNHRRFIPHTGTRSKMQTHNLLRLFDDLVGAGEDRWRDCQAERLGGLQVDHQLESRRLLDW